jgi:hypothetical protein
MVPRSNGFFAYAKLHIVSIANIDWLIRYYIPASVLAATTAAAGGGGVLTGIGIPRAVARAYVLTGLSRTDPSAIEWCSSIHAAVGAAAATTWTSRGGTVIVFNHHIPAVGDANGRHGCCEHVCWDNIHWGS